MDEMRSQIQNVLSVGAAHDLFENEQIKNNNALKKDLAQVILENPSILGEANDYHNLAVQYTNEDDYVTGFQLVEKGLVQYPNNIDLLADAVYYGSNANQYDKCKEYADRLMQRPRALWNWRAFTFLIDYYLQKSDWTDDFNETLEDTQRALTLALDYEAYMPTEEKGFRAEYKVRDVLVRLYKEKQQQGDTVDGQKTNAELQQEAAENALKRAIDAGTFAATQCCLRYADILFESCRYQEVIDVCEKAFSQVETQPSIRLDYMLYLRALSMDALVHREKAYNEERVSAVYQAYRAVLRTTRRFNENIGMRMGLMETLSGISPDD